MLLYGMMRTYLYTILLLQGTMPVINFNYNDLCSLIGQDVPKDVLINRIPLIGADMHDTEGDSDEMSVEFFPDRPDLFSVEGLARSMRAFLDIEPGMIEYDVQPTDITVNVDESVKNVRPYILCAAVTGVTITDDSLRSLMEMQEKLHVTIGRKRSKVAIGIHDMDKVTQPFTYKAVSPKDVSFVPLAKTEKWNLDEILKKHEKGKEYAHLLKGKKTYPLITDSKNRVLSFPPIINGALTAVTTETVNLFVDVTGTDPRAVKGSLDLVVTALAERGGKIGSVKMSGSYSEVSPNLEPTEWKIGIEPCERFLGIDIGGNGIVESLRRMGLDAIADGEEILVSAPCTRLDMMHPIDIYEDVSIGYGFERFGGEHTVSQTNGELSHISTTFENIRDMMVGMGYMEVTTLTLSSEKDEFELSGIPEVNVVRVLNPITEDHTCLRATLMPSLMRILRRNKHRDLPQRIFEVGDSVQDSKRQHRLCVMSAHSKASFTESKSIAESVMREMGIEFILRPSKYRTFVDGRGAEIISNGEVIGYFGEMSPDVITDFEIGHPIIFLEMDITSFIEKASRGII